MDELRSAFTVISLLTFILIVAWAWSPAFKRRGQLAVTDLMTDDDRNRSVTGERENKHG